MMKLVGDDLYWILAIFKLTLRQGSRKMGANHPKNLNRRPMWMSSLIIGSDATKNGLLIVKSNDDFCTGLLAPPGWECAHPAEGCRSWRWWPRWERWVGRRRPLRTAHARPSSAPWWPSALLWCPWSSRTGCTRNSPWRRSRDRTGAAGRPLGRRQFPEQGKLIKWGRRITTELPPPPTPTVWVRQWSIPPSLILGHLVVKGSQVIDLKERNGKTQRRFWSTVCWL